MGAVGWLARQQLRSRWWTVAGLALLVGMTGGAVLSTAAGARRTADVYDRFVAATATRDVQVQVDSEEPDAVLTAIEELDVVRASGRLEIAPVAPDPGDVDTDELDLALMVSPDGRWGVDVDRPRLLGGRMPDPDRSDEVLINELAAGQMGLGVGDQLTVTAFTPEALDSVLGGGEFLGFTGPELELEVVGVGRQATDLQGADIAAGAMLLGTPALAAELDGRAGMLRGMLGAVLRPGTSEARFRTAVRDLMGDTEYDVGFAEDEFGESTRNATVVLANALWAFAAAAGAAAVVAVGGALSRAYAGGRHAGSVLTALGCSRRERVAALSAAPFAGVVGGAILAVGVAALASTRFPVGFARRVEATPGAEVDALVLGLGALAMVVAGGAWCWRVGHGDRGDRRIFTGRPPVWRRVAAGLPVTPAIGVTYAFQRRADERAVPVGPTLAAVTVGVLGVLATVTVVRSLDELVDEPRRYGWGWSAEPDVYDEDIHGVAGSIVGTDGVAAVGVRDNRRVEINGTVVNAHALAVVDGDIGFPIRSGRAPRSDTEVALGAGTAEAVGVTVGDFVTALPAEGEDPVELTVVGTAVFPPVESSDPATGALLTPDGLDGVAQSGGFRSLVVRYEQDADAAAVEAAVMEAHPETVDYSIYSRPRLPGSLENLRRAMPIVAWLGVFLAALGLTGLAHGLVVGTRRRRRELATLRALGLRRRDVRAVVVANGVAIAAVGVVVGIPLGLVAGRSTWEVVIGGHGLLTGTALPATAVAVAVPAALVAAFAISWWPGQRASAASAIDLRRE